MNEKLAYTYFFSMSDEESRSARNRKKGYIINNLLTSSVRLISSVS